MLCACPAESLHTTISRATCPAVRAELTDVGFVVHVYPGCETVHVMPIGDLDIATTPELDDRVCSVREAGGFTCLVLDLRGLTFIDATGLHLILKWDAQARQSRQGEFDFALIAGSPAIQRVFKLAGLFSKLPFLGLPASM